MQRNPTAEFTGHIEAARIELASISKQLDDHLDVDPDRVHWANVGDANRLRDELRSIAVRLLRRGEYAG